MNTFCVPYKHGAASGTTPLQVFAALTTWSLGTQLTAGHDVKANLVAGQRTGEATGTKLQT